MQINITNFLEKNSYSIYYELDFLIKQKNKIFLEKIWNYINNKLKFIFDSENKFLTEEEKNREILFYQVENWIKKPWNLSELEKNTIINYWTILSKQKAFLENKNISSFQ